MMYQNVPDLINSKMSSLLHNLKNKYKSILINNFFRLKRINNTCFVPYVPPKRDLFVGPLILLFTHNTIL